MSHSRKMIVIIFAIILIVIIVVGIIISIFIRNPKWKEINEIKECKGFFDSPIIEIELIKLNRKVIFSDDDLIDEWNDFFKTLEIKRDYSQSKNEKNLNKSVTLLKVKTESSEYLFSLVSFPKDGEGILKIDDAYYFFKSDTTFPFDQTYDIAKERHGQINLWE